jgi:hypothetical protein
MSFRLGDVRSASWALLKSWAPLKATAAPSSERDRHNNTGQRCFQFVRAVRVSNVGRASSIGAGDAGLEATNSAWTVSEINAGAPLLKIANPRSANSTALWTTSNFDELGPETRWSANPESFLEIVYS